MADRENRNYDESEGSLDPETIYTKEYCIGSFPRWPQITHPSRAAN